MDNKTKTTSKLLQHTLNQISSPKLMIFNNSTQIFSQKKYNLSISTLSKQGKRSQVFSKGKGLLKIMETKKIKQQNIRLLTKLIQIKQKKNKFTQMTPIFMPKSRQNPERSRQILHQNKRLGNSLFLIRTGKTIQRVKTEICEKMEQMLRKQRANQHKSDYNLFFQERKSLSQQEESKIKEKLNDRSLKNQYL